MRKLTLVIICFLFFAASCNNDSSYSDRDSFYLEEPSMYDETFEDGYDWASDNDIDDFDYCQDQFGAGDAEDGCNEYVKDEYSGYQTFNGYECTEDCSGHEAGYNWAEENYIEDENDCNGNSDSFIEGCMSYVEEKY